MKGENMLIDFSEIKETVASNFKGGEGDFCFRSFADDKIKINDIRINPGTYNGMHAHIGNCEVIYVLEGELLIKNEDGTEEYVLPGQVTYCPEGTAHSVCCGGQGPVHFIGIVPEHHM